MGYLLFTKQKIKDLLGVTAGEVVGDSQSATLTNKIIDVGYTYGGNPAGNIIKFGYENPYLASPTGASPTRLGYYPAQSTTQGFGILDNQTSIGTDGNLRDTTEGFGRTKATGAVSGNNAGIRQQTQRFRREWGIYVIGRIALSSTSNIRAFFGFSSNAAEIAGETTLNNESGFGIGKRAADTNWFTYRNDADATEDRVDTGIAVTTAFVTLEMQLNSTDFRCRIGGVEQTVQTTELPAAATDLAFHWEIETSDGVDKTLNILPIWGRSGV